MRREDWRTKPSMSSLNVGAERSSTIRGTGRVRDRQKDARSRAVPAHLRNKPQCGVCKRCKGANTLRNSGSVRFSSKPNLGKRARAFAVPPTAYWVLLVAKACSINKAPEPG